MERGVNERGDDSDVIPRLKQGEDDYQGDGDDGGGRDYDMRKEVSLHRKKLKKLKKLKNKKKKRVRDDVEDNVGDADDGFRVDVSDSRFSALLLSSSSMTSSSSSSSLFGIDPTHPSFLHTAEMERVMGEQRKSKKKSKKSKGVKKRRME